MINKRYKDRLFCLLFGKQKCKFSWEEAWQPETKATVMES